MRILPSPSLWCKKPFCIFYHPYPCKGKKWCKSGPRHGCPTLPCDGSGGKQAALFQTVKDHCPILFQGLQSWQWHSSLCPWASHLSFTLFTTADPIVVSVTYSLQYRRLHQSTTATNSLAVRSPIWGMCVMRCACACLGVHLLAWHNRIYLRIAQHLHPQSHIGRYTTHESPS